MERSLLKTTLEGLGQVQGWAGPGGPRVVVGRGVLGGAGNENMKNNRCCLFLFRTIFGHFVFDKNFGRGGGPGQGRRGKGKHP